MPSTTSESIVVEVITNHRLLYYTIDKQFDLSIMLIIHSELCHCIAVIMKCYITDLLTPCSKKSLITY